MNRHASVALAQVACPPALAGPLRRASASLHAFSREVVAGIVDTLTRLRMQRADRLRDIGHARKEWQIRRLEESYARATDAHDVERMERDWERRDGGGLRDWR